MRNRLVIRILFAIKNLTAKGNPRLLVVAKLSLLRRLVVYNIALESRHGIHVLVILIIIDIRLSTEDRLATANKHLRCGDASPSILLRLL